MGWKMRADGGSKDEEASRMTNAAYLRDWRSWGVWVYLWPLGILAYFIDRRLAK
jgi:hypothetical protein